MYSVTVSCHAKAVVRLSVMHWQATCLCMRCFQLIGCQDDSDWLLNTYIKQVTIGCANAGCKNKWCVRSGLLVPAANDDAARAWAQTLIKAGEADTPPSYFVCVSSSYKTFPGAAVDTSAAAGHTSAVGSTAAVAASTAPAAPRIISSRSTKAAKDKKSSVAGAYF